MESWLWWGPVTECATVHATSTLVDIVHLGAEAILKSCVDAAVAVAAAVAGGHEKGLPQVFGVSNVHTTSGAPVAQR